MHSDKVFGGIRCGKSFPSTSSKTHCINSLNLNSNFLDFSICFESNKPIVVRDGSKFSKDSNI